MDIALILAKKNKENTQQSLALRSELVKDEYSVGYFPLQVTSLFSIWFKRPTIVHVFGMPKKAILRALNIIAPQSKIVVSLGSHEMPASYGYPFIDQLIVPSNRAKHISILNGYSGDSISVIPQIIPSFHGTADPILLSAYNLKPMQYVLCSVESQEEMTVIQNAWFRLDASIRKRNRLVIAAKKEQRFAMRLDPSIVYIGHQNDRVIDVLSQSAIHSISYDTAFVEQMAARGLVSVTSMLNQISHAVCVDMRDSAEIAVALQAMILDPMTARLAGIEARRASSKQHPTVIAHAMTSVYESLQTAVHQKQPIKS